MKANIETSNETPSVSTRRAAEKSDQEDEVLPESILVKNVLLEMTSSMRTLLQLSTLMKRHPTFVEECQFIDSNLKRKIMSLKEILDAYQKFQEEQARSLQLSSQEPYDGDTEIGNTERLTFSKRVRRLRRRSRVRGSMSLASSSRLSISAIAAREDQKIILEEAVTDAVKDIVFMAQNDRNMATGMKLLLSERTVDLPNNAIRFLEQLEMFQDYAISRIMVSHAAHSEQIESLCNSINLKMKYNKVIKRLQTGLEQIKDNEEQCLAEQDKERQVLIKSVWEVREEAANAIQNHLDHVNSRIKVVAWNSHGRQLKAMEQITDLRNELEDALDEHGGAEVKMRHEILKMEADLEELINKYDEEMFQRFNAILKVSKDHTEEKVCVFITFMSKICWQKQ